MSKDDEDSTQEVDNPSDCLYPGLGVDILLQPTTGAKAARPSARPEVAAES